MGESKNNLATEGLSGQVGNFIFRRRKSDGKVFVARHPAEREGETTEAQKAVQSKFQQAIIYGKSAIADPASKAQYAAQTTGGQSAFNVAVADFFNAPDIEEIDVTNYTGKIGSPIRIRVTDDFKVTKVDVHIANADGSAVEEGSALQQSNGIDWLFTAAQENSVLSGDRITVTVSDIPHNIKVEEKVIS